MGDLFQLRADGFIDFRNAVAVDAAPERRNEVGPTSSSSSSEVKRPPSIAGEGRLFRNYSVENVVEKLLVSN
jgi:hypothetical protein